MQHFLQLGIFVPLVCVNMSTQSVWVNFWELIIIIIDCFLDFTDST